MKIKKGMTKWMLVTLVTFFFGVGCGDGSSGGSGGFGNVKVSLVDGAACGRAVVGQQVSLCNQVDAVQGQCAPNVIIAQGETLVDGSVTLTDVSREGALCASVEGYGGGVCSASSMISIPICSLP